MLGLPVKTMLMIEGLSWRRAGHVREDHGSECIRYNCAEHARVFLLMQRTGPDAPWVETFHVKGVSTQHWHSAREAIAAAEANPCLARRVSDDQALTRCDQYPQCPCGGPEGWR